MKFSNLMATGLLASAACTAAIAQTNTPATERPKPVGVSQETANKANAEAIKRGDTATVVRTGPSAGDKMSNAKDKVTDSAGSASRDASNAATTTKHKAKAADAKVKAKATEETTRP